MAPGPGFGSNNPFRRKGSTSVGGGTAPASATTVDDDVALDARPQPASGIFSVHEFQRQLQALPKSEAPPPSTTFQKKKPVKKVRVQSPPPSSPESASAEHSYPRYPLPPREDDDDSSVTSESINGEKEDPFQNEAPPMSPHDYSPDERIEPPSQPGPVPANPFGKTLEDVEQGADSGEGGHAAAGKGGLDVEAFRRLLLTGQASTPGSALSLSSSTSTPTPASTHPHPAGIAGDGGSITDASSISRQSYFDAAHPLQETPRTSHEISEPDVEDEKQSLVSTPQVKRQTSRKKPPPPPSSRHGKSVKVEPKERPKEPFASERPGSSGQGNGSPTSPRRPSSSSSDVNKPLPPPPARIEDDVKDIFDKEAAGRTPEIDIDPEADVVPSPRPPTPPNASHSSSTPVPNPTSTLRKPAPPPRRQSHHRTDSKLGSRLPADHAEDVTVTPPRSSLESISRSSSIRLNINAPAPPPPRRATHGHRVSPSVTSPVGANYSPSFPFPTGAPSPGSEADRNPAISHLTHSQPGASPSGSGTTTSSTSVNLPTTSAFPKSPPPLPPARNASVRKSAGRRDISGGGAGRPSSAHGHEPGVRKISREGAGPPPPPPPRARGSSRGSIGSRRTSMDSVRRLGDPRLDPGGSGVAPVQEEIDGELDTSGQTVDFILADLNELQREVDAARERYERAGGI